MAGRHPKPIKLQLLQGNPNRKTKKEIAERLAAEIKLGDNHYICPEYLRTDKIAVCKWNEIIGYFKKHKEFADLVTSTDVNTIALCCQCFSEYITLIELRNKAKTNKAKIKFQVLSIKTKDQYLKLLRELFLTPMSKIRNIPKAPKDKSNPLEDQGFGNI